MNRIYLSGNCRKKVIVASHNGMYEDYIDKKLIDSYKNMHITYAEITLNYEPNIHYVV